MNISEWIIDELGSHDKKMDFDELLESLAPDEDPAAAREALGQLIAEGKVLRTKKGKLFLPAAGLLYAVAGRQEGGFAFLPDAEGDIYISEENKGGAMHGDLVVEQLSPAETDRKRGRGR